MSNIQNIISDQLEESRILKYLQKTSLPLSSMEKEYGTQVGNNKTKIVNYKIQVVKGEAQ